MSDDLISRSAFIEEMCGNCGECSLHGKNKVCKAIEIIANQPTAYNVDKVVEQLEEVKKDIYGIYNSESKEMPSVKIGFNEGIDKAIEIVKGGME